MCPLASYISAKDRSGGHLQTVAKRVQENKWSKIIEHTSKTTPPCLARRDQSCVASMYFVFAVQISVMAMFLLKWLIPKMRQDLMKELTKYKKSNGLAEQAEWLEIKAVLRAFIEHCKFCYDETYSPDDAIESVLDNSKEGWPGFV